MQGILIGIYPRLGSRFGFLQQMGGKATKPRNLGILLRWLNNPSTLPTRHVNGAFGATFRHCLYVITNPVKLKQARETIPPFLEVFFRYTHDLDLVGGAVDKTNGRIRLGDT